MKISALDTTQIFKVLKAALYVSVSALVSQLLTSISNQPELFGIYTVFINAILVFIKQLFTPVEG